MASIQLQLLINDNERKQVRLLAAPASLHTYVPVEEPLVPFKTWGCS